MKIKMLKTTPGSPDGIIIKSYLKDEVYDLSERLCNCFFKMRVAEKFVEKKEEVVEVKKEKEIKKEKPEKNKKKDDNFNNKKIEVPNNKKFD